MTPYRCKKCNARLMDLDQEILKLALSLLPQYNKGNKIIEIQCFKKDCHHHNIIKT